MVRMVELTQDEVHAMIPYEIICETKESVRWNTFTRKRLWNQQFSETEKRNATRLFPLARKWTLVTGVPNTVRMSTDTMRLWQKLGNFCASLH